MNNQLLDYIKSKSLAGDSKDKIKQDLLSVGWKEEDTEKAFLEFASSSIPAPDYSNISQNLDQKSAGKDINKKSKKRLWWILFLILLLIGIYYFFIRDNKLLRQEPVLISNPSSPNYLKIGDRVNFYCDLDKKEYTNLFEYNSSCVSDLYNEKFPDDLTIKIVEPKNDSEVKLGEKYNIIWDANKINASRVYIRIRDDSSGICKSMYACYNFEELATVDNTGIFVWDTTQFPFKPGDKYKIKIDANNYQGLSEGYFSIVLPNVIKYCPVGGDFYDSDYTSCLCPATTDNFVKRKALKSTGTNTITHMPTYKEVPGMYYCKSLKDNMMVYKPVIYLYPQKTEKVSVNLNYDGNIFVSYPSIDKNNNWNVIANPDSTLLNLADNKEYSYLFWEGIPNTKINYDMSKGFLVKGEDTAKFLQEKLKNIGLTPKEYNEFIVYWYPKMKDNKYNIIHFASKTEYDDHAKLTINPNPDSLLRVFMVYHATDNQDTKVTPQSFIKFVRKGFSVVEWGGTEIK